MAASTDKPIYGPGTMTLENTVPIAPDDPVDNVNHPSHYTSHPSGVECIRVTRAMSFDLGNAFKYVFRHGDKGKPIEDLEKAIFYLRDSREPFVMSLKGDHRVSSLDLVEVSVLVGRIIATEPNENVAKALEGIWHAEAFRDYFGVCKAENYILKEIDRLKALEEGSENV